MGGDNPGARAATFDVVRVFGKRERRKVARRRQVGVKRSISQWRQIHCTGGLLRRLLRLSLRIGISAERVNDSRRSCGIRDRAAAFLYCKTFEGWRDDHVVDEALSV
jgi:hypothetical protein